MNICRKLAVTGLVVVILVAALAACGAHAGGISTGTRVMAASNNVPGHFNYSYRLFSGEEGQWTSVKDGQAIAVLYTAEVKKGSLSLEVWDQNKTAVWNADMSKASGDSVTVPIEKSGDYAVVVVGKDTEGSFDVSWQIQ